MVSVKSIVTLLLFLFVFCFPVYAATVKGFATDKESGEPLVGAIVILENTKLGTVTGLDGSYTISNVPAGAYKLTIKYTAYESAVENITLSDNQVLTLNIKLVQKTSVIKEVEVRGKHANGSDEQARSREKNADEVMNIMSAKTIELSPDITVANVLQRVSAVSTQRDVNGEARYAIIRGMDKRYNYTSVDGVKIPSPDDKQRYVPMDIFPAEILERVEVIKTLTPSMEGDAIGGVMNMVTKDAPDNFILNASAATGYNDNLFHNKFNYFDPSAIQEKDPISLHGVTYNAVPADFNRSTLNTQAIQATPNSTMSLTIGNRFLKDKKLGVIFSGSFQNLYTSSDRTFFYPANLPTILRPSSNQSTWVSNFPEFDDILLIRYSTRETRIGLHTKVDYKFNERNSISLYGLFVQLNQYQNWYETDSVITAVNRPGIGQGNVDYPELSRLSKQRIMNFALEGKHLLADHLKLDWKTVYSSAENDIPDQAQVNSEAARKKDTLGNFYMTPTLLKSMGYEWRNTKDQNLQANVNLTYTSSIFGKDVELKVGGMYRHKERSNYYNKYSINPSSGQIPYNGVNGVTDSMLKVTNPLGNATDWQDYKVHENITAGYIQGRVNFINDKLEALGGVRIESTDQGYTTNKDPYVFDAVSGSFNYLDILPSLQFKYALNPRTNIRLAYFTSISRPGFFEVIPYTISSADNNNGFPESGNPYLRHTLAQNFDLRYEFFPKGIDQILIGVFYKSITDPIEYAVTQDASGVSNFGMLPINGNPATNYGVEIQITKFIHSFGISANYTYTHSATTGNINSYAPKPSTPSTDTIFHNIPQSRPLQGQAEHIANISLLYRNPKIGFDANISWNYTGQYIKFLYGFIGLDYWQDPVSIFSFSCEKRIAKNISIYAKINNLFNETSIVEMHFPNKYFKDPNLISYYLPLQNLSNGNTIVDKNTYGRNYLIGIRYKIN